MKKNTLPALVAAICTLAGVVCMLLRQWFLTAGFDQKALPVSGHPGDIASWVITAVVLVALCVLAVCCKPQCRFHTGKLSATGSFLQVLALGYAITVIGIGSTLSTVTSLAALVAAFCGMGRVVLHFTDKKTPALLYCAPVVIFLLLVLCRYQYWSSEPLLQLFGFQLLALICLTVSTYHRAAMEVKLGSSSMYFFFSNASLFLCLAAIPGDGMSLFLLLMAFSTLFDGCATTVAAEA